MSVEPDREEPPRPAGPTVFFRNLADSVATSTRNLRIALAFLTVSFVVVAACLAWVLFRAVENQEETRASLEARMKGAGADLDKQTRLLLQAVKALEARQAALEAALAKEMAATRAEAAKEGDAARAEALAMRQELERVRRSSGELRTWADGFVKTYTHDRDLIVERIGGLPARAPTRR